MNSVHFSSRQQDWGTPQPFFDVLDREFGFTLDSCATLDNAKCAEWIPPEADALTMRWDGVVWMNPPYGYGIGKWIQKAYEEAQKGAVVVALIPARTETGWWHDYVMKADEIRLIRGRMKFVTPAEFGDLIGHNAPFPSVVVVFRPGDRTPRLTTMNREGTSNA